MPYRVRLRLRSGPDTPIDGGHFPGDAPRVGELLVLESPGRSVTARVDSISGSPSRVPGAAREAIVDATEI